MRALDHDATRFQQENTPERFRVVVIGGGQAGLSVGYHLARRRIPFVILDANRRIGDSWRNRWETLRLFTPAQFDGLDGLRFPAKARTFPTRNEMADYLAAYAAHFDLPVLNGTKVDRLTRTREGGYLVGAGARSFAAEHVVVAMANYQAPIIPPFAQDLDPAILQLHSAAYRNPGQLRDGPVLVVGAGNSGAEIAVELARTHRTTLSGRDVGEVPFRMEGILGRYLLAHLVLRLAFHRVLTLGTPIGRKAAPKMIHRAAPLIRVKARELAAAGVARVPRTVAVRDGRPVLADGRVLDVGNLVWCTGYRPGFDWIELPIFDRAGEPRHRRGVVGDESGLYFVGLHFLYAMSSTMIQGVGRDSAYIAEAIAARLAGAAPASVQAAKTGVDLGLRHAAS